MYLIYKLLLNSIYGKFGMQDDLPIHVIVNSDKLDKIIETKAKITSTKLDNNLYLVSYYEKDDEKLIDDFRK